MEKPERLSNIRKKMGWLLPFVLAVAILTLIMLRKDSGIPSWVEWNTKRTEGKLVLELSRKKAVLWDTDGSKLFSSEKAVKVQDALLADLDGDGSEELLLLVWKRGRYGAHRPFWVEEDEKTYSQHLFVYHFDQTGKLTPLWFSSEMGMDVRSMETHEKNASLLVLEDREGAKTVWRWTDFGPELVGN